MPPSLRHQKQSLQGCPQAAEQEPNALTAPERPVLPPPPSARRFIALPPSARGAKPRSQEPHSSQRINLAFTKAGADTATQLHFGACYWVIIFKWCDLTSSSCEAPPSSGVLALVGGSFPGLPPDQHVSRASGSPPGASVQTASRSFLPSIGCQFWTGPLWCSSTCPWCFARRPTDDRARRVAQGFQLSTFSAWRRHLLCPARTMSHLEARLDLPLPCHRPVEKSSPGDMPCAGPRGVSAAWVPHELAEALCSQPPTPGSNISWGGLISSPRGMTKLSILLYLYPQLRVPSALS